MSADMLAADVQKCLNTQIWKMFGVIK